eukprot:c1817_g1_i1.p1 GENE.c1817_g1_i1~~c1817_g1_i1.p1  ORF type:complete len:132 (+),score=29.53 c1817_g1_i1:27-422(+)
MDGEQAEKEVKDEGKEEVSEPADQRTSVEGNQDGKAKSIVQDDGKVVVLFEPAGNAPKLKQTLFKMNADGAFQTIIEFLRRQLRCKPTDSLFLFCNGSFAPTPDALVADVAQCFPSKGRLVVNYCLTPAWG